MVTWVPASSPHLAAPLRSHHPKILRKVGSDSVAPSRAPHAAIDNGIPAGAAVLQRRWPAGPSLHAATVCRRCAVLEGWWQIPLNYLLSLVSQVSLQPFTATRCAAGRTPVQKQMCCRLGRHRCRCSRTAPTAGSRSMHLVHLACQSQVARMGKVRPQ